MEKAILESYIYLVFQLVQNYIFKFDKGEVSVTKKKFTYIQAK